LTEIKAQVMEKPSKTPRVNGHRRSLPIGWKEKVYKTKSTIKLQQTPFQVISAVRPGVNIVPNIDQFYLDMLDKYRELAGPIPGYIPNGTYVDKPE
jgi:hypothetical protein